MGSALGITQGGLMVELSSSHRDIPTYRQIPDARSSSFSIGNTDVSPARKRGIDVINRTKIKVSEFKKKYRECVRLRDDSNTHMI